MVRRDRRSSQEFRPFDIRSSSSYVRPPITVPYVGRLIQKGGLLRSTLDLPFILQTCPTLRYHRRPLATAPQLHHVRPLQHSLRPWLRASDGIRAQPHLQRRLLRHSQLRTPPAAPRNNLCRHAGGSVVGNRHTPLYVVRLRIRTRCTDRSVLIPTHVQTRTTRSPRRRWLGPLLRTRPLSTMPLRAPVLVSSHPCRPTFEPV